MLAPEPIRHADLPKLGALDCGRCDLRYHTEERGPLGHIITRCRLHGHVAHYRSPACTDMQRHGGPCVPCKPKPRIPRQEAPAPAVVPDRCPHCGSGMICRDPDGLACGACGWHDWLAARQYGYQGSITAGTLPSFLRGAGRMTE